MLPVLGGQPLHGHVVRVAPPDRLPLPPQIRPPTRLSPEVRYLLGSPPHITALRPQDSEEPAALVQVMLARRTHTNEPARSATLLPALAHLPPPLALIEVGASAALT